MMYVVNIQYQGVTETIEVFERERDAIDCFAEALKDDIPGIGHKIAHKDGDFWYVHWENLQELLDDTKYDGSQLYHCKVQSKEESSYWQPEIERLQETQRAINLAYLNLTATGKFTKEICGTDSTAHEHIENMLMSLAECQERNKELILAFREIEKENDSEN